MSTVLLAYEREQDLAAIEKVLQTRGLRVVKARSGLDALEILRHDPPDFVVSDVLLPLLDGFALCRRMKEDATLQRVPMVLFSLRVEGPKYEAFAAEVGADRFMARGCTLDDLVKALDDLSPGSGTMRMPALVPELLERREQDRRRLADVERQLQDLEAANQKLAESERGAREKAEYESRARAEFAASESHRIKDLLSRIRELETAQQQLAQAESKARSTADETRIEAGRLATLEARLVEVQGARTRAQAEVADIERAFAVQPTPTWVSDMESREVLMVNDAAAALFGIAADQLKGRLLNDLLPGFDPGDDTSRPADATFARPDGSPAVMEVQRHPLSFDSRPCWLMAARDVTAERGERTRQTQQQQRSRVLDLLPLPSCVVDSDGKLQYANAAFLDLLGIPVERVTEFNLQEFEAGPYGDTTIRGAVITESGFAKQETRWRRPDDKVIDVEIASAASPELPGMRVLSVLDISGRQQAARRIERDQRRAVGLLDLTQRAPSLTEAEILSNALEFAQELTGSTAGYVFLAQMDGTQVEIAARHDTAATAGAPSASSHWRGRPPAGSVLFECLNSQRPIIREAAEASGTLRTAGLPESLARQLASPILEGGRLVGVLLVADKPEPYDDDDRRHAAHIADALWKLLRRRRSDSEIVSAMDHMERVMFGAIEALAALSESQDGCKMGRSRRVADLSAGIGLGLGLPGHTVRGLRVIAQLIDVGMLHIPRELLWRPGTLSASEFELVKTHVDRGAETLRRIEFPWPVADAVRQHHERLDGSGYPLGLKGDEIMLEARIVAVADAVEAMLAPRPQRPALSLGACIDELQSQAGRRYDARVVKSCIKVLRDREAHPAPKAVTEVAAPAGQRIA
jgi:response regulator RpfG family c-di-GMP phosphodiesterase